MQDEEADTALVFFCFRYTVTSDLVPASRDWVGLYKVGWMSPRDYVYYEWAPCPKDYEIGKEAEASVLFPSMFEINLIPSTDCCLHVLIIYIIVKIKDLFHLQ